MLQSMTGFGRMEQTIGDKTYLVELKALNGKQFDLQLKIPSLLKPYEFDIRSHLQEKLIRGTVECVIIIKQNGATRPVVINTDLIRAYYEQLSALATELKIDTQSVLGSLLRLPEVVMPATDTLGNEDFAAFKIVLEQAVEQLIQHRKEEGAVLMHDLMLRLEMIREQELAILTFEPNRTVKIRQEIQDLLQKYVGKDHIDANRMEQELIYYMEKIDIHEEQIRLRQHCEYLLEVMKVPDISKGKKLSFILQEIGREINTTGSKAYDVDIQKCVVVMKDELEKAKEQVLNVL